MFQYFFKFFFILIILFSAIQCKKPKEIPAEKTVVHISDYDHLVSQYNRSQVLVALYFTNKCIRRKIEKLDNNPINYCNLEESIPLFFSEKMLLDCKPDFDRVRKWCLTDERFNKIPFTSDEGVTFAEIIYNIETDRFFFKKYLKNKDQYFGSLDFQQSCSLYYDVVLYVSELEQKDAEVFFQNYFAYYAKSK